MQEMKRELKRLQVTELLLVHYVHMHHHVLFTHSPRKGSVLMDVMSAEASGPNKAMGSRSHHQRHRAAD